MTRREAYALLMRKLTAELLGTFMLVFAGTGAVMVNHLHGGAITHPGIAFTFGLVVLAIIYAIGDISGAHINPAVTVGFWLARRFSGELVVPYIIAQCMGAIAASLVLWVMFPTSMTFGETVPAGSVYQSLALEVILTWFLMFVILGVSTGSKEKGMLAGVAVGAVVTLAAMFGGPVSGASMNPARSLGPAVVGGTLDTIWIYFAAPTFGAALAVITCRHIHGPQEENQPPEKSAQSAGKSN